MNIFEEKQRMQVSIKEIEETIKKIQKAISDSVKEEEGKRQKIEEDLEKSLNEIR